jgi:hypothetical protein
MPIELPDFKDAHFGWMTVCGEVSPLEKQLKKWMEGEKDKVSSFKTERGLAHVRLMLGGGTGRHFHIDVFGPNMSFKNAPKKSSLAPMVEIQESASKLFGKTVDANVEAGFRGKFDELPDSGIIRYMFFQKKVGNVAIKSNGAKLLIEGAPIQELTWFAPDDNTIHVTLEAKVLKKSISDDYLTSAIAMMEQAFNIFVLGKAQNESR